MTNPTRGGDAAYAKTRRRGVPATISRLSSTSADPETGLRSESYLTTVVRWAMVEPTQWSRLVRAEAAQQKIGLTTITLWLRDVQSEFTSLDAEDYVTVGGIRYDVVRTTIEDTSFIIFCEEYVK